MVRRVGWWQEAAISAEEHAPPPAPQTAIVTRGESQDKLAARLKSLGEVFAKSQSQEAERYKASTGQGYTVEDRCRVGLMPKERTSVTYCPVLLTPAYSAGAESTSRAPS